jgi:quercetin dioxygenase-like cupin family protein
MGPYGVPSHPPHKHKHEELIMVIEGTLDFNLNGVTSRGGPGSIMFSGPWDLHGISNPANAHVKYYVMEMGTQFK